MDAFFAEYSDYSFDPMRPIVEQFKRMARELHFGEIKTKEAREDLRGAMVLDFNDVFGVDENDLESWQRLCRLLQVSPIPDNIDECHAVCSFPYCHSW